MDSWEALKKLIESGQKDIVTENDLEQCFIASGVGVAHTIPDSAFLGCRSLKEVRIPTGVTSIGIIFQ